MTELVQVRRAAKAKARAEATYRASLVQAVHDLEAAGDPSPYARVAEEAGVSRQAVRELVRRACPPVDNATREENAMRERLEVLDATWERAIDRLTDRPGYMKRVTAFQNARAKKLRRRGLAYPAVSVQMRDYAESCLLRVLEDLPDDPRVQRIVRDLDEAAALRKTLEAIDEARMGF